MATQTYVIHAWLADKDGYFVQELNAPASADDFATFAKNAAANGQTATDATVVGAKRPPDRPAAPPVADPLKATYATALTTDAKVDVIAQKLGLK